MPNLLIAGSGNIGSVIGQLLTQSGSGYQVIIADLSEKSPAHLPLNSNLRYEQLNVQDSAQLERTIQRHEIHAVISCLPYFVNLDVAKVAKKLNIHYFDLTEDVAATAAIQELAKNADCAFVPQCGVAPGFINMVAFNLIQEFDQVDTLKLRCGALPAHTDNDLQYALTWSIDGLINEYGNPCQTIVAGEKTFVPPLTDLEEVTIDGSRYEAFNTSGGLGTLAEILDHQVQHLNYKTLRYPGHCQKMHFLMNGLQLNNDRDVLKNILQKNLPHTRDDVVLIYVSAHGYQQGRLMQHSYVNHFYPCMIEDQLFTAIQITTGSAVCAVVDMVFKQPKKFKGFIHQTQFKLNDFLHNRFAEYFHPHGECDHE